MATLEEIYAKIASDDAEKRAFAEAFATEEGAATFMAQRDCEARPAELVALLKSKAGAAGEVSDEALEGAAGGRGLDWFISVVSVGIVCGVIAGISALSDAYEDVAEALFKDSRESELDMCDKGRSA